MCNANEVVSVLQHIYIDKTVELITVTKNNGKVLQGIQIKDSNSNIAPVIYIHHDDVDGAVDYICKVYDQQTELDFDMSMLNEFDTCKDFIRVMVVNKDRNVGILDNYIGRDFLDLWVIPFIAIESCQGTVKITKRLAQSWKVDFDEIIDTGINNLINEKAYITPINEIIFEMTGTEFDTPCNMWVMHNNEKSYMAAKLLDEKRFEKFANEVETDLLIIPSSINELIILPYDIDGLECVNDMIVEVNRTEVSEEEILSDHYYIYSRSEGWKY